MSLCITSQTHVYNAQPCDPSGDCKNPDRVRMGPRTPLTLSFSPTSLFPSPRKQCLVLKRFVFLGGQMQVDKRREKIWEKRANNKGMWGEREIKRLDDGEVSKKASKEEKASEKCRRWEKESDTISWCQGCSVSSAVSRSNSAPCAFN